MLSRILYIRSDCSQEKLPLAFSAEQSERYSWLVMLLCNQMQRLSRWESASCLGAWSGLGSSTRSCWERKLKS